MSNIQKQHKISPAIAWLTIQKFIIFYCPLDGEHTTPSGGAFFRSIQFEAKNVISPRLPLPADSSCDILPVHHHRHPAYQEYGS